MDTALATPAETSSSEAPEAPRAPKAPKAPKAPGTKNRGNSPEPAVKKPKKTPGAKPKTKQRNINGKNQKLGKLGEDLACIYLADNGFTILRRNWECYSGEADIVATEGDTLVFIEVKTRSKSFPGLPEYAVTEARRARYENIAHSYLSFYKRPSGPIRFDVIAIRMTGAQQCLLRHHRDAFGGRE